MVVVEEVTPLMEVLHIIQMVVVEQVSMDKVLMELLDLLVVHLVMSIIGVVEVDQPHIILD